MFTPGEIAMMVAEFAFFPVLGWVSLRYLRAASDFPHKREMIRGAKWGGLIMSLVLMGPIFAGMVMYHREVPYASTVFGGFYMILGAYLVVARWWLVWETAGVFVALSLASERLKGEPTDLPTAISKWEEQRQSRWARAIPWVGGVIFLLWTGITVLAFVPMDRQMQAIKADRALEAEAAQALGDLPLKTVMVDRQWHIWSPLMPIMLGPLFSIPGHPDANLLWVILKEDAPEGSIERAASAAEAFLEAKGMRGEWVIRTSVPCDRRQDRVWRGGG
ncbi:MAG: hypothetical protein J7M38_09185 [Armatimonadetes bacterium]|nr:hypothetical protein [Armatimonadota bacterium]